MKKNLYIHIGTGKTGTTAIQDFLLDNDEILKESYNLKYMATGRYGSSHHPTCLNSFGPVRTDDAYSKVKNNLEQIVSEASKENVDNFLISSENYPGLSRDEIRSVYFDFLSKYFNVFIIVYLRRQDEYLESWFAQLVKTSRGRQNIYGLLNELKNKGHLDYKSLILKWADSFGLDRIIVRPYEKSQLRNGDIRHDFMSLFGIGVLDGFVLSDNKANSSLSRDQMILINGFQNAGLDEFLDEVIRKPFDFDLPQSKYFLSPAERDSLIKEFSDSNRFVAEECLGRADGRLFFNELPSVTEPEWKPVGQPSVEYTLRALTHLLAKQNLKFTEELSALKEEMELLKRQVNDHR